MRHTVGARCSNDLRRTVGWYEVRRDRSGAASRGVAGWWQWWSWPALAVSAVLAGLLAATYVNAPATVGDAETRRGAAGGLLTFFAVGCPVCNKVVLVALGSAGAMTWFEPVQPFLQLAAIGLLAWALDTRIRTQLTCTIDRAAFTRTPA